MTFEEWFAGRIDWPSDGTNEEVAVWYAAKRLMVEAWEHGYAAGRLSVLGEHEEERQSEEAMDDLARQRG